MSTQIEEGIEEGVKDPDDNLIDSLIDDVHFDDLGCRSDWSILHLLSEACW